MATEKVKQKQQRQISSHDLEAYQYEGWKKVKNVGQSSVIIEREVEVEVDVPETELQKIDRQIKELQEKRKALLGAGKKDEK